MSKERPCPLAIFLCLAAYLFSTGIGSYGRSTDLEAPLLGMQSGAYEGTGALSLAFAELRSYKCTPNNAAEKTPQVSTT